MLATEASLFQAARKALEPLLGPVELESPTWPWAHTQYYTRELGAPLLRRFLFFAPEAPADLLVSRKQATREIERHLGVADPGFPGGLRRRINLDPGYLEPSKVVLASTKNFAHRIYLGEGIFAEVTLSFREGAFHPLSYTYPDFRSPHYREMFRRVRRAWLEGRRQGRPIPQNLLADLHPQEPPSPGAPS